MLCVQNIPGPLRVGHRIGQDPENDSCAGCGKVEEQWVLSLYGECTHYFSWNPIYLFTSLLGVDLAVNKLALRS